MRLLYTLYKGSISYEIICQCQLITTQIERTTVSSPVVTLAIFPLVFTGLRRDQKPSGGACHLLYTSMGRDHVLTPPCWSRQPICISRPRSLFVYYKLTLQSKARPVTQSMRKSGTGGVKEILCHMRSSLDTHLVFSHRLGTWTVFRRDEKGHTIHTAFIWDKS